MPKHVDAGRDLPALYILVDELLRQALRRPGGDDFLQTVHDALNLRARDATDEINTDYPAGLIEEAMGIIAQARHDPG